MKDCVSRGRTGPFADIADHVETVGIALTDTATLTTAMAGMDCVINLARSVDKSWAAALDHDVATTVSVAGAALGAGVGRLIYTGTIASYDMSDPSVTITEATGFGDLVEVTSGAVAQEAEQGGRGWRRGSRLTPHAHSALDGSNHR